jgi:hypothetical protein
MSKKKKTNKYLGSRFKRMKQPGRLQSAKSWLPTYKGKNILQGYRKQYGVDLLCAIRELEILGIALNPEYIKAVKQSIEGGLLARKRKKIEKQEELEGVYGVDYDEYFSFIAGHTEGGASYGVPWES